MIILSTGLPGSGKSTLLHRLVAEQAHVQRFFVTDREHGWGPEGWHWLGQPPENIVLIGKHDRLPDPLPEVGVFVFRKWDPLAVARLAIQKGSTTYVNEEIDQIAKKKGWDENPLRDIVHEGRHLENEHGNETQVNVMGAARRFANLATDLSELADQIYIFRSKGLNTLARLEAEHIIDESQWPEVMALPNFHCWFYDGTTATGSWQEVDLPPGFRV